MCESDAGAMVLGASARGRGNEESSACRDVAEGLEWVVENCALCQGKRLFSGSVLVGGCECRYYWNAEG